MVPAFHILMAAVLASGKGTGDSAEIDAGVRGIEAAFAP